MSKCYVQVCSQVTSTAQNHALLLEVKMHSTIVYLTTSMLVTANKQIQYLQYLMYLTPLFLPVVRPYQDQFYAYACSQCDHISM